MKVIFIFLLAFTVEIRAQDIDYNEITVSYVRLPLKPLDKNIKNYQFFITQEFLSKNEENKIENEKRIKEAEEKYKKALAEHQKKQSEATVKYQKDLLLWMALPPKTQGLTVKPEPPNLAAPQKELPDLLAVQKTFENETLLKNLSIDGFNNSQENALLLQLFLQGFESKAPIEKVSSKEEKQNDKYVKVNYYQYTVQYKHPLKVKMLSPFSGMLMDEHFSSSLNTFNYTSKEFRLKSDLEKWWQEQQQNEYESMQDYAVKTNLKNFNHFLNSNFGYSPMHRTFSIAFVDAKKNYDDLKAALVQAKTGYPLLKDEKTREQGIDYIIKAIEIWEKALAESNPGNKKARIDENVTEAILYNLSEAYAWINQFNKCNENLNRLFSFKISNKERRLASATQSFCEDQKIRLQANP